MRRELAPGTSIPPLSMTALPRPGGVAEKYLDAWIAASGIGDDKKGPLFRSFHDQAARAGGRPALLTCCHTFRATGITTYMTIESNTLIGPLSPSPLVVL
jgi:hypothetical protein